MKRSDDPFAELRSRLENAAARQRAPEKIQRPSRFGGLKGRIAVVTVGAALITGTAVAATTPWNPSVGGDDGAKAPTRAESALPAEQISALAVLRRPQDETDRSQVVEKALRRIGDTLGSGIHIEGVRVLRADAVNPVLLVPFEHVGPADAGFDQGLCVFGAAYGTDQPRASRAELPILLAASSSPRWRELQHPRPPPAQTPTRTRNGTSGHRH